MKFGFKVHCSAVLLGVSLGLGGCQEGNVAPPDYTEARSQFQTKLVRHSPAPQDGPPLKAPPGAVQVTYSQSPKLVGWLSTNPPGEDPGIKRPAIVFLHGGFALSREDWDMAKPYRDAGYIVFMPALRGENGQSGEYSMFYNEVTDVVAALDFVLKRPNLSHRQVYLAGHSVGGTLALLTAMTTDKAKAVVSFSAAPDVRAWSKAQPEVVPFNPTEEREFEMRSPQSFQVVSRFRFACITETVSHGVGKLRKSSLWRPRMPAKLKFRLMLCQPITSPPSRLRCRAV